MVAVVVAVRNQEGIVAVDIVVGVDTDPEAAEVVVHDLVPDPLMGATYHVHVRDQSVAIFRVEPVFHARVLFHEALVFRV